MVNFQAGTHAEHRAAVEHPLAVLEGPGRPVAAAPCGGGGLGAEDLLPQAAPFGLGGGTVFPQGVNQAVGLAGNHRKAAFLVDNGFGQMPFGLGEFGDFRGAQRVRVAGNRHRDQRGQLADADGSGDAAHGFQSVLGQAHFDDGELAAAVDGDMAAGRQGQAAAVPFGHGQGQVGTGRRRVGGTAERRFTVFLQAVGAEFGFTGSILARQGNRTGGSHQPQNLGRRLRFVP